MNWLINILEEIKWKAQDFIWAIQDKIQLNKELKQIDNRWSVEEVEAKPRKKKAKNKSVKKNKKSV